MPHLKNKMDGLAVLHTMRRILRGTAPNTVSEDSLFAFHTHTYSAATHTVRFFYIITVWPVLNMLWANWLPWRSASELDLIWPVAWFPLLPPALGVDLIGLLALLGAFLPLLFPQSRPVRILAFISFFLLMAFANSFGKINHNMHAWMAFLFAFIFIPPGNWNQGAASVRFRQRFLTAVWFGMALMSLFYTMSGILKIYGIGFQLSNGMVSALHPHGLAYQVMGRLLQTNTGSIFGHLLLNAPWLGWPMYIAAIYIETFALAAVFRPRLHLVWGLALISLHLGNWLLLSIPFTANIVLLGFLFVNSPFRPPSLKLTAIYQDLPPLSWARQITNKK